MPLEILADPMGYLSSIVATAATPDPLVVMIGDSLVYGIADANNVGAVQWFGVDSAFSSVTFASDQAANTNDPPPFGAEIGPESLVAYNPGVSPGFGFEITLMKTLHTLSSKYAYLVKCGIISALLDTHWLPTATYGASLSGGNLYRNQIARIHSYESSTGRQVAIIVVVLGTNDGSDAGAAGRMAANMGAMVTALHSEFPNAKIVWPLVNVNTVQTPNNIPTVRTQMLTYAATAPAYFMMPNIDEFALAAGDPFHWATPYVLQAGQVFAYAGLDLAGGSRPAAVTTPAVVGVGVPLSSNTSTLTPLPEAGTLDNDTLVAFAFCNSTTPGGGAGTQTISCSAGWTLVAGASGQTSAVGFTSTWAVYTRKVAVGEVETDTVSPSKNRRATPPTFTFTNGGDNLATVLTVRGPTPGAQAVDVSQKAVLNAFGTGAFTVPAFTTTHINDLAIYFVGGAGSMGNASTLTGVTSLTKIGEANFSFPSSDAGLIGIYTAPAAAAGAVGPASLSFTGNALAFAAALALNP